MNARHAALLTALALTIAACAGGSNPVQSGSAAVAAMPDTATMTVQERVKAGRALWEEKCRTVAGEKIYRTVENVEGILLMKLRRAGPSEELSDPNWPGAAFATERTDGAYIETFLGYEHSSDPRGFYARWHTNANYPDVSWIYKYQPKSRRRPWLPLGRCHRRKGWQALAVFGTLVRTVANRQGLPEGLYQVLA